MENKEILVIIGFIITVISWLTNSYFNRQNEKFKRWLDYRVELLNDFLIDADKFIKDNRMIDLWNLLWTFRYKLFLFWSNKENYLCDKVLKSLLKNEWTDEEKEKIFNKNFTDFRKLLLNNFRNNIGLENINLK